MFALSPNLFATGHFLSPPLLNIPMKVLVAKKRFHEYKYPGVAFLCKYCHLSKKVAPYTPCLNHLDKNRLWILDQSLPGVTLYSGKIWSQWLHFCLIVQFGHCLWCLLVGFCVFKFSLYPLGTSLPRETDWKLTT